ncbi:hypothetical protein Tco_1271254, partial [Tanacetum coccineum]
MDVNHSGLRFTWNQKPQGDFGVLKKFDCVMANIHFNDSYVGAHAFFQPYRISDHSPTVLKLPMMSKARPKTFKFPNILVNDDRFQDVVSEGWNTFISGIFMFKVIKKLKILKKPLRKLLYDKGNIHLNVTRLRTELDKVQTDLDADPFNLKLRDEEAAYVKAFNDAVLMQERFLQQKTKVEWLKAGDSNSAYFHKVVKGHLSRSRIDAISCSDGSHLEGDHVAAAFVSHYTSFLGQQGVPHLFNNNDLFVNMLYSNVALDMIKTVTPQEVKEAIFSMGNDKSPGPDGYTAAFFKEAWGIISHDVTMVVQEFFTNGTLLKELNHTIIALIPKVASPSRINDYRPISCCNVLYKCISKILSNRIKDCLKDLVSPNQSTFVPGRRISDNILLTQEIMHNYHLDRGPPRCAFKVDIQKAYDTVDWDFLREVMIGFGFHHRMITWIMECVSSTSFSISINGSLHGFFKGKRGLRQGGPLSPYLFTLVMEVFTLMLQRRIRESQSFSYHRYCSKLDLINLCFADDLFIFAHGDADLARVIMDSLDEFKEAYGLVYRDYRELIERIHNRIRDWKNKSLYAAGRLQLIRSVIGSMHVYWASVFILPTRILLDIEQLMRGFLWCQGDMRKGKAKVAWDVVCLPKKEGGLGVRKLDSFNKALMIAHIWSLLTHKESLWVRWIHAYKIKERSFWDIPICGNMTWSWRKILQLRPILWWFVWYKIGDG